MEVGHPLNPEFVETSPVFFGIYDTFNIGEECFDRRMLLLPEEGSYIFDVIYDLYARRGKKVFAVDWVFKFKDFGKQLRLAPLIVVVSSTEYQYFEVVQFNDGRFYWGLRWADVIDRHGNFLMDDGFCFLYDLFRLVLNSIVDDLDMPARVQEDYGMYSITSVIKTLFGGYPFVRLHSDIQPTKIHKFLKGWFGLLYHGIYDVVVFDDPDQNFPPDQLDRCGTVYRVRCNDEYDFRVQAFFDRNGTIIKFIKAGTIPIPNPVDMEDKFERNLTR
jgi:hypothetical protein